MKKLLLSATLALFAAASFAQTPIYSQNFETTKTATPGGWKQEVSTTNGGWQFNNTYGSVMNSYIGAHTYCAFVDDYDNNYPAKNPNHDTLYTGSFDCSAATAVYMGLDYNFWIDQGSETANLLISIDGGATWTKMISLGQTGGYWQDGNIWNITSYAAGHANVMLAFTYFDGYPGGSYAATFVGFDNLNVYAPAQYDLGVTSQNLLPLMQVGKAYTFSGALYNYGSTAITSMNMNYRVNGGAIQTQSIGSINITPLNSYNWTLSSIPYTPGSSGTYTVKYWADNLNGNNDGAHANDTLVATFQAYDSLVTKYPLFEEFNQASCDPCAAATPNLDSVLYNNRNYCNAVRYHVSWPGQDFMNQVTNTPFVNTRVGYYSVSGVPDAKLDGSMDMYPGSISSTDIQNEAAIGSPFRITIKTCTYNPLTNVYNLSADVKSYGNFSSGLSARVALTIDTINYANNQSTESIPQTNFPQVAEDMMPGPNGTTLSAFTPYSVQTVTTNWTKNHAWGASNKSWLYDSTLLNHITIWIQDNSSKYVYQSATAVATIATGIQEVSKGVYMDVYPNPTSGDAYVAYSLKQGQNVSVNVYNMLGEKVYSQNEGKVDAGKHIITIDGKSLQNGVYFVKFSTDNGTTTKRLVIQR